MREICGRLGLVLGSLLAFLVVGELVVRWWFPPAPFGSDLTLAFRFHPGRELHYRSQQGEFDVRSTYNAVGMHDVDHPLEKPPGTRRILVIGDSFMEAKQVRLEDIFPRQLERRLTGEVTVEVINAGRSGSGSIEQHLVLRHFGVDRDPDLVIQAFFMNDVFNDLGRAPEVEWDEQGRPLRMKQRPWGWRFPLFLRDRWERLPFGSREDLVTRIGIVPEDPFAVLRLGAEAEYDEHWQRTLGALEASAKLAWEHGAGYLLLVVPISLQVYPDLRDAVADTWRLKPGGLTRDPQDQLLRFGRERGIRVIDLLPFLEAHRDRRLYFVYDGHWTPAAHALVADRVADSLRQHGWGLPGSRPTSVASEALD